ncbi:hypothetical protein IE81DRAFT_102982 [Ceraceosorus guamensis]|uniref:Uncharacterized protein n=1 Tax=Ceraceosorus guamensis TaxID=1522189 RepID=A0A316VZW7_9BASI|nr:hypothetical protein IE81DRAFT_102982 [Ceraceosorus guamensis]PWN43070.1 hypothetical protein IE81DRAFT_102982 [Ceraceosorus guamensis]
MIQIRKSRHTTSQKKRLEAVVHAAPHLGPRCHSPVALKEADHPSEVGARQACHDLAEAADLEVLSWAKGRLKRHSPSADTAAEEADSHHAQLHARIGCWCGEVVAKRDNRGSALGLHCQAEHLEAVQSRCRFFHRHLCRSRQTQHRRVAMMHHNQRMDGACASFSCSSRDRQSRYSSRGLSFRTIETSPRSDTLVNQSRRGWLPEKRVCSMVNLCTRGPKCAATQAHSLELTNETPRSARQGERRLRCCCW